MAQGSMSSSAPAAPALLLQVQRASAEGVLPLVELLSAAPLSVLRALLDFAAPPKAKEGEEEHVGAGERLRREEPGRTLR